jgi:hypothetical protein
MARPLGEPKICTRSMMLLVKASILREVDVSEEEGQQQQEKKEEGG